MSTARVPIDTGAPVCLTPESIRSTSTLPVYVTPQQVAEMLQVDERTVLRWAQQDASLPVSRIGRVIRFERAALLRWLERKKPRGARQVAHAPAQAGATPA
jgi:excisionase family DNA binding protein